MVFIKSPDYTFDLLVLEQEDLQAARIAAISLPITSDFKDLGIPVLPYHSYTFLSGRADKYRFDDRYTTSHVEIINGEAKLTAQYTTGHPNVLERKVGNIEYYGDAVMQEFYGPPFGNPVSFVDLGNGTSITGYYDGDGAQDFITPISIYSDIIQKIPGNK